MSKPLEHAYKRLAENPSMEENAPKISSFVSSTLSEDEKNFSLNFKETELRLGLPGSESPERKSATGVSLFGMDLQNNNNRSSTCSASTSPSALKNLVAGAKRVFSDSFNESSGKWVFSVSDGSEVDLGKNATFFCPRGVNAEKPLVSLEVKINNSKQNSSVSHASSIKEVGLVSQSAKSAQEKKPGSNEHGSAPAAKAQVVGWPPIRSFRKNSMASNLSKNNNEAEGKPGFGCLYVKVSMDGAPYLRKVDLKTYSNYVELSSALERMFSCFTIGQCSPCGIPRKDGLSESSLRDLLHASEYVLTYEDKDGDWMLVGDVPWEMFTESCRRLRIMKGSEAIGLAPRAMEKSRNQD